MKKLKERYESDFKSPIKYELLFGCWDSPEVAIYWDQIELLHLGVQDITDFIGELEEIQELMIEGDEDEEIPKS